MSFSPHMNRNWRKLVNFGKLQLYLPAVTWLLPRHSDLPPNTTFIENILIPLQGPCPMTLHASANYRTLQACFYHLTRENSLHFTSLVFQCTLHPTLRFYYFNSLKQALGVTLESTLINILHLNATAIMQCALSNIFEKRKHKPERINLPWPTIKSACKFLKSFLS